LGSEQIGRGMTTEDMKPKLPSIGFDKIVIIQVYA
jgi:hypothetical protein